MKDENKNKCPFCGNEDFSIIRDMLKPWGFAPRNAEPIFDVQLSEEYSSAQQPLYSTLPEAEEMKLVSGCQNIRMAPRTNQRIIMINSGLADKGFMVCKDCGAAMPGDDLKVLYDIQRPYKSKYIKTRCKHSSVININLGYDFVTDMIVLEFALDNDVIDVNSKNNIWVRRAAQSLAEAFRLEVSRKIDIV